MIDSDFSIGLARAADIDRIAAMSRDLIEQGLRWSWTPKRVAASVRSPQANVIVARADERIVGFGIMRYGDEESHLDLLGVDPTRRRQGLGRRLVEWLEKPALEGGMSAVVLEVRSANREAQAFYETLGYRKLNEIRGYYQGRESATRMRHALGHTQPPSRGADR
jgi:ribosomal-protein-alanine N-acetyltransferase